MATPRFREQLNQAERAFRNDEFEAAVSLLRGARAAPGLEA